MITPHKLPAVTGIIAQVTARMLPSTINQITRSLPQSHLRETVIYPGLLDEVRRLTAMALPAAIAEQIGRSATKTSLRFVADILKPRPAWANSPGNPVLDQD